MAEPGTNFLPRIKTFLRKRLHKFRVPKADIIHSNRPKRNRRLTQIIPSEEPLEAGHNLPIEWPAWVRWVEIHNLNQISGPRTSTPELPTVDPHPPAPASGILPSNNLPAESDHDEISDSQESDPIIEEEEIIGFNVLGAMDESFHNHDENAQQAPVPDNDSISGHDSGFDEPESSFSSH